MSEERYTRKGNAIFDRGEGIILLDREEEWELLKPILAEASRAEKLEAALREILITAEDYHDGGHDDCPNCQDVKAARALLEPHRRRNDKRATNGRYDR
ncbi:MAG: hypothetical protein KGJ13_07910 [Patescibacteria group bacterium]|nr:hypothetical protein [Patescibacteria group bacterium]